jgi:hypothetical protein
LSFFPVRLLLLLLLSLLFRHVFDSRDARASCDFLR